MDKDRRKKPGRLIGTLFVPVIVLLLIAVAGWVGLKEDEAARVPWWATLLALVLAALAVAYLVYLYVRIQRVIPGQENLAHPKSRESDDQSPLFVDSLTGLHARRWFEDTLGSEIARSKRYHRHLSLVVLDIDHFDRLNRVHGRRLGDHVVKEVANILRSSLRNTDHLARFEDEEFVAALSETNMDGALLAAERLREAVWEYQFQEGLKVTVSIGVAEVEDSDSAESFFHRGKAAAMTARRDGGNSVATATY